jgi:DHA1 family bicyclomycin/chloramphenicol resistance-like MFS transporter
VFAVFAGGILAPRLAKRWSGARSILFGLSFMLAGAVILLALGTFAAPNMTMVLAPLVLFLFGMGVVNPLSTVIAMGPFPEKAGAASALVGFCQMAGGALGTVVVGVLPYPILQSLPLIMAGAALIGLLTVVAGHRRLVSQNS